MTEYFCNGYYCECGQKVGVMRREVSTMADPGANPHGQVGVLIECPNCSRTRWLTHEEMLALPEKWILEE